MFTIKIAELHIMIDNRYPFVESVCEKFIVDDKQYDFSVSVSNEELINEYNVSGKSFSPGYIESVCIYRQIAAKLPDFDAFVFHSAAIKYKDIGFCFAARSGTGKTTHINLWRKVYGENVKVINGDKPIIRIIDGTPYVYGTPWSGKERLEANDSVRLFNLCFIERDEVNSIKPISKFDVLGKILQQTYIPNDAVGRQKTLVLIEAMIEKTHLWKLCCNMSDDAAILACTTMCNED